MVTTPIAQMSDLLAPISKSTTRTSSTYTNGSVRGYSVGVEVQKQRQSAVKLGSRPNFRTDHAGFPNPVPPRSNPGINHRKTKIFFIFQYDMAEGSSHFPARSHPTLTPRTGQRLPRNRKERLGANHNTIGSKPSCSLSSRLTIHLHCPAN
jgi:hypothetical protein